MQKNSKGFKQIKASTLLPKFQGKPRHVSSISSRPLQALLRRHLHHFLLEERVVGRTTGFSPQAFVSLLGGQAPALRPEQLRGEAPRTSTARARPQRDLPHRAAPALRRLWQQEPAPATWRTASPQVSSAPPRPAGERPGVAFSAALIGPWRRQSPVHVETPMPSRRHTPARPLSAPDWPGRR